MTRHELRHYRLGARAEGLRSTTIAVSAAQKLVDYAAVVAIALYITLDGKVMVAYGARRAAGSRKNRVAKSARAKNEPLQSA